MQRQFGRWRRVSSCVPSKHDVAVLAGGRQLRGREILIERLASEHFPMPFYDYLQLVGLQIRSKMQKHCEDKHQDKHYFYTRKVDKCVSGWGLQTQCTL